MFSVGRRDSLPIGTYPPRPLAPPSVGGRFVLLPCGTQTARFTPSRLALSAAALCTHHNGTAQTHTQALATAKATKNGKPKLIVCKTIIGKGIDAVAGTNAAHGEAGVEYTDESRKSIGLPEEKWFVSGDTRSFFKDHATSLTKT